MKIEIGQSYIIDGVKSISSLSWGHFDYRPWIVNKKIPITVIDITQKWDPEGVVIFTINNKKLEDTDSYKLYKNSLIYLREAEVYFSPFKYNKLKVL